MVLRRRWIGVSRFRERGDPLRKLIGVAGFISAGQHVENNITPPHVREWQNELMKSDVPSRDVAFSRSNCGNKIFENGLLPVCWHQPQDKRHGICSLAAPVVLVHLQIEQFRVENVFSDCARRAYLRLIQPAKRHRHLAPASLASSLGQTTP